MELDTRPSEEEERRMPRGSLELPPGFRAGQPWPAVAAAQAAAALQVGALALACTCT